MRTRLKRPPPPKPKGTGIFDSNGVEMQNGSLVTFENFPDADIDPLLEWMHRHKAFFHSRTLNGRQWTWSGKVAVPWFEGQMPIDEHHAIVDELRAKFFKRIVR